MNVNLKCIISEKNLFVKVKSYSKEKSFCKNININAFNFGHTYKTIIYRGSLDFTVGPYNGTDETITEIETEGEASSNNP